MGVSLFSTNYLTFFFVRFVFGIPSVGYSWPSLFGKVPWKCFRTLILDFYALHSKKCFSGFVDMTSDSLSVRCNCSWTTYESSVRHRIWHSTQSSKVDKTPFSILDVKDGQPMLANGMQTSILRLHSMSESSRFEE